MAEDFSPQRIICLTEETVETLYLLGEQNRIVGVSGFAVRPKGVRKQKPTVSTFIDAKIDDILALKPDLVIGFSDIQANMAQALIAKGITVWINNYRSVDGILKMIWQLGTMVGKSNEAHALIKNYQQTIARLKSRAEGRQIKPKVYFEEWFDPLISGIGWVSELIEIAGGIDIYSEHRLSPLAKDHIIASPNDVVERNPDIILASWCGKKFKKDKLVNRENWNNINGVKNDLVFEIHSSIILQPGPAALTDGLQKIASIIEHWQLHHGLKKV